MTTVSTVFDTTAANAALKELYDGQAVENLVYADNPFLALVPKSTDFGGKYYPIPIISGVSQGRSATFATAQANITAPLIESFLLTRVKDYSVAQISNELMEASRTDKMAFLQGSKTNIDAAIRSLTNSIASALFRSGSGTIGKIAAAGITSGVITLDDPSTVTQFEVNMVLEASGTDGGAAYSGTAPLGYVIKVDRTAGTITVASSGFGGTAASPNNGGGNWAAADYLRVQGDRNAKCSGLAGWFPTTAPVLGSDSFYGVDRGGDPTRLAGVRYDGSSQSIEEALIDGSMYLSREGGKPNVAIMSYTSYGALEKALGAKAQYVEWKGPAEIMFRGIRLNGYNSEIKVFPDRSCPGAKCYLLQMDTLKLLSLTECPHIIRGDGLDMLRASTSDAYEVRVAAYYNLACNAPGWNAVVSLAQ